MVTSVGIALKSSGISEIQNALKGVKKSLIELEKDSVAASKSASKARLDILYAEHKEREHLAKRTAEVESKLGRGFGRGAGTRPATTGSGGYGSLGAIPGFAAQQLGVGGIVKLGASAGLTGAAFGLAFAAFKGGLDIATSALKMFGNFMLNDIIKPELSMKNKYAQLSAKSAELGGRGLTAEDAKKAAGLSFIKWNLPKEEAVKAMEAYGSHGGEGAWSDAPKVLDLAAKEALIRGGTAETYAKVIAGFRVKGESSDDTIAKYLATRRQGDIMDVPVEELQNRGKQIKAASLFMGGSSMQKFGTANVMVQKSSEWTADPASAITGLNKFTSDVMINPKKVAYTKYKKFIEKDANGSEVIGNAGHLLGQVLHDMAGKPGNLPGLGFKDVRGQRFIMSNTTEYDSYKGQARKEGLTDKGKINDRALVLWNEAFDKSTKETDSMASINAEAAERIKDSGNNVENAFNQIKSVLADQFMPSVEKMLQDLVPFFEDFAAFLEDNQSSIEESLDGLAKSFIVGVRLMEMGLKGMMMIVDIIGSIPGALSLIPTIGPLLEISKNMKDQTGKGLIDTMYDSTGGGPEEQSNRDSRKRRREIRAGGELEPMEALADGPWRPGSEPAPKQVLLGPYFGNLNGGGANTAPAAADTSATKAPESNVDPSVMSEFNKQVKDATGALSKLNRTKSILDSGKF